VQAYGGESSICVGAATCNLHHATCNLGHASYKVVRVQAYGGESSIFSGGAELAAEDGQAEMVRHKTTVLLRVVSLPSLFQPDGADVSVRNPSIRTSVLARAKRCALLLRGCTCRCLSRARARVHACERARAATRAVRRVGRCRCVRG
jgi:hypothetical protein